MTRPSEPPPLPDWDEPFVQAQGIATTDIDGDKVVMHLGNGNIWGLNQTAAAIWDCFAAPSSCQQTAVRLVERFDIDLETCRAEVRDVCARAAAAGFLVPAGDRA